jgi:hypothetical protein
MLTPLLNGITSAAAAGRLKGLPRHKLIERTAFDDVDGASVGWRSMAPAAPTTRPPEKFGACCGSGGADGI